jgi:hypothetical protein
VIRSIVLVNAIASDELNLAADLAETHAHILLAALIGSLLIAQSSDPTAAHDRVTRSISRLPDDPWATSSDDT